MTAHEIIEKVVNMVEEVYDNEIWYGWIETVLEELTPLAKTVAESTIPLTIANEAATISLSSTYLTDPFEVVSVALQSTGERKKQLRKLPAYDSVSLGWVHSGTSLTLQNLPVTAADAVVTYYQDLSMTLSTASTNDYTINLPEEYHDIVVKGLCALAMQKEEEGDRKGDFYGEYTLGKRRLLAERIMAVEPWNAQAVRGGETK
jgi:hypothetical protein